MAYPFLLEIADNHSLETHPVDDVQTLHTLLDKEAELFMNPQMRDECRSLESTIHSYASYGAEVPEVWHVGSTSFTVYWQRH